jgi:acetyltransferase-like isoleucine patch superfamily enzyme
VIFRFFVRKLQRSLQQEKRAKFSRRVPFGDLITERLDNAAEYGFGEGTTCYDSVVILGDVKVGRNCWIILDGSGGLVIGDFCSFSAGSQVYTHNTVSRDTSLHRLPVDRAPTRIGNGVYVGPNAVIQMGVTIGDSVTIGALSFVNEDLPPGSVAFGSPARIVRRHGGQ